MPALRYYAGPILRLDFGFAIFLAVFVACTGMLAADYLGTSPWVARAATLSAGLGVVCGAADVAEDLKLRSILEHAERVLGARQLSVSAPRSTSDDHAAVLEAADAAQVDAANALTRIKLVMLEASIIGGLALFVADHLVGAVSGGPGSGASTPRPQPGQGSGAVPT